MLYLNYHIDIMNNRYRTFLVIGGILVALGSIGLWGLSQPKTTQVIKLEDATTALSVRSGEILQFDIIESNSIGIRFVSIQNDCQQGLVFVDSSSTNVGNGKVGGDSIKKSFRYKVARDFAACSIIAQVDYRGTVQLRKADITPRGLYGID